MKNIQSFEEYVVNEGFSDIKDKVMSFIKSMKITPELISEVKEKFSNLTPTEIKEKIKIDWNILFDKATSSVLVVALMTIFQKFNFGGEFINSTSDFLKYWIAYTLITYILERYNVWKKVGL